MLSPDPSPFGGITRRRVLVHGSRGLVLFALLAAGTACGSSPPPGPDPLEQQAELARHDSELAAAAAKAAPPALVPALTEVAAERARHAAALTEEIARAAGKPTPEPTTTSPATTSAAATPPPTVADVVTALRSSADSATTLAPTLSGYRAGLLGSIAASCVTAYTVALPSGKGGQ
ncbi:hypothetical protein ORI20_18565 [Mycobacterium sp. CVI_P3]|uniref:Tat pathway signal protein n=1 Tax=Mycobacterium pinniadriaticum TaxID=2994102 RepID=A0ABT3SHJ6_9MYCO|nr:hypothetical protein [Mycobacterium pinniadriaticum]MCX2932281.1 hypothetical protein [Mycobacterium pinniadriaticum]MCX2938619.1 hypothetical protein [Mycobacterium pinniadriaticum]